MTRKNFGPGSTAPKLWRIGTELLREDQGLVLMAFEDRRYVEGKPPAWTRKLMPGGEAWPPQFASDIDWLGHTQFVVTMNGRLDKRSRECREAPTWPTRPDLRDASMAEQARFAPNLRYDGWSADLGQNPEQRLRDAEDEEATRGMTADQVLAYHRNRGDGA
jgi:hypothetical protein